ESALEVLDEIRLGGVTLLVEDIAPEPEKVPPPAARPPVPTEPRIAPERMVEHLCRIGEGVLADTESRTTSEALVADVLADFGGGALFLLLGELDDHGTKLIVASEQSWLSMGEELLDQLRSRREAPQSLTEGGAFEGRLGR